MSYCLRVPVLLGESDTEIDERRKVTRLPTQQLLPGIDGLLPLSSECLRETQEVAGCGTVFLVQELPAQLGSLPGLPPREGRLRGASNDPGVGRVILAGSLIRWERDAVC